MITTIERLVGVEGNLNMLVAVMHSTRIMQTESSDLVDLLEGMCEDIHVAIEKLKREGEE